MIRNAVLFRGAQPATYIREVDTWVAEHADPALARSGGGRDEGHARLDLKSLTLEGPDLADALNDDMSLLLPERTLVVDNCQAWSASDIADLVEILEQADTEWSAAFILRSGAVPKALTKATTEDDRDRRIDVGTPAAAASWASAWLEQRGVDLPKPLALRLAEHTGENAEALVATAVALAEAAPAEGRWRPTWEQIETRLGGLGGAPVYKITGAIASGRSQESLEMLTRLLGADVHPLVVLKLVSNRYRNYGLVVDSGLSPDAAAERTGVSKGAASFLLREARTLGPARLMRAFAHIARAEDDLKGGSSADDRLAVEVLVLALTKQFAAAQKDRR